MNYLWRCRQLQVRHNIARLQPDRQQTAAASTNKKKTKNTEPHGNRLVYSSAEVHNNTTGQEVIMHGTNPQTHPKTEASSVPQQPSCQFLRTTLLHPKTRNEDQTLVNSNSTYHTLRAEPQNGQHNATRDTKQTCIKSIETRLQ